MLAVAGSVGPPAQVALLIEANLSYSSHPLTLALRHWSSLSPSSLLTEATKHVPSCLGDLELVPGAPLARGLQRYIQLLSEHAPLDESPHINTFAPKDSRTTVGTYSSDAGHH